LTKTRAKLADLEKQLKRTVQVLQNLWDGRAAQAKRILALEEAVQALALQNSFGSDAMPEPEIGITPDPIFTPTQAPAHEPEPLPAPVPYVGRRTIQLQNRSGGGRDSGEHQRKSEPGGLVTHFPPIAAAHPIPRAVVGRSSSVRGPSSYPDGNPAPRDAPANPRPPRKKKDAREELLMLNPEWHDADPDDDQEAEP
jgi:hypothetical protein